MVKPIMFAFGAIPVIMALLIAIPMLTKQETSITASGPNDVIELEYTKHLLKKVSFGVTENVVAQKTEVLLVTNDGKTRYTLIDEGLPKPDITSEVDEVTMRRLTALIKETGFMTIESESFPVRDDVEQYQKFTLKITLNNQIIQIHWPEQNATEKFVPPLITLVEAELDRIIDQLE